MTDKEIVEKMHGYFLDAQRLLLAWAGQNLPKLTRDWWRDRVLPHLRPIDLNAVPDKYVPSLDKLDLSTLCKVVKLNVNAINDKVCAVTGEQRRALNEMIDVRNHWSHSGATLPKQNIIEQDVEIVRVFFIGFTASAADVSDVIGFSGKLGVGGQTTMQTAVVNDGGNMVMKTGFYAGLNYSTFCLASKNNSYRYILGAKGLHPLFCIGINPSSATQDDPDPAIKQLIQITQFQPNRFDSWIMLNLFPQRGTNPKNLNGALSATTVHSENRKVFEQYVVNGSTILCSWGDSIENKELKACLKDIYSSLSNKVNIRWLYIKDLTKKGNPRYINPTKGKHVSPNSALHDFVCFPGYINSL